MVIAVLLDLGGLPLSEAMTVSVYSDISFTNGRTERDKERREKEERREREKESIDKPNGGQGDRQKKGKCRWVGSGESEGDIKREKSGKEGGEEESERKKKSALNHLGGTLREMKLSAGGAIKALRSLFSPQTVSTFISV